MRENVFDKLEFGGEVFIMESLGAYMYELMQHKFISKAAKIVAKIGNFLCWCMISIGMILMLLDKFLELFNGTPSGKWHWPGYLIGISGIIIFFVLFSIARRIDKKHQSSESAEDIYN